MELAYIVSENSRLMAGARDGDVAEAGIKQIGMNARIGVDKNTLSGEPLRAVAGHCVSKIEVPVGLGVKLDLLPIVESCGNLSVGSNRIDYCEVTICDAESFVRRRELNPVAHREFIRHLPVDTDISRTPDRPGTAQSSAPEDQPLIRCS